MQVQKTVTIANKYVPRNHFALIDDQNYVHAEGNFENIYEMWTKTTGLSIAKITGSWEINHEVSREEYEQKKRHRLSYS